ncbi:MAG TPA: hypothetical protein VHG28_05020, partial [Longimicrobiaceae bacterium]|nr:hypothetical protein [Longimicrobiaceae bacterium]
MRTPFLAVAALVVAAGCTGDDDSDPTASSQGAAFLSCVFGSGIQLGVGEVRAFRGTEGEVLCVDAGGDAAEFTLVPFFASSNGEARLRVSTLGGNLQPVTGPPNPSLGGEEVPGADLPARDQEFHLRVLNEARRILRIRSASPGTAPLASRAGGSQPAPSAAPPSVGDVITLTVPRFDLSGVNPCEVVHTQQGRVAAVSQRAILVNDVANPSGGLTDAELQTFGQQFDDLVYPVDTQYFGTPTDIDQNGRVIIFFTRRVNELTPPNSGGYVGGFFWAGDLFPRQATQRFDACPRGNVAEIFYILAADPQGSINNNPRSRDLVLRSSLGTIAHELEHLINASRRMFVNNANRFEETWLDEGLAHSAEELVFYQATGLGPRQNIDLARLTSSPAITSAVNQYMIENFGRLLTYME